ncbi:hypothetical protein ISCGN_009680 [Ixodes scapularis]
MRREGRTRPVLDTLDANTTSPTSGGPRLPFRRIVDRSLHSFLAGSDVQSNRSLVVFGVACLAVSRRSLRSFLAERRPKTYRRALYVPLSGGGRKRGLHRYCHHHSLKTYSRALPGSASLCPVVVASEACNGIAITIV